MTDEDTRTRLEALDGDPEAFSAWIEALIEQSDRRLPEVARWAAERGDIELLMILMDDYVVHCEMRTVAAIREALPTLGEAITARVRTMLDHEASEERRAGALFAGLLGLEALAPRLIEALEDRYFLTRMEAATALGKLRHRPAVPELRRSLRDEDILTRIAAIEALTLIPDPELKTAYTGRFVDDPPEYHYGALDDASPRARADAIRLLRRHRPTCAREVLVEYVATFEEMEAEAKAEDGEITAEDREVVMLARQVLAELDDG
ncbi:HEAT repeat domain-containing protein [Paraliomyxa miuraensis]|uniref:HEAT repeat domain-containing protein n=1 Tax=Paraliomyxa miuraensis TaxID=376150 RepID=UPI002255123B|nr:HEAT repeat domain-containing protein [Paraliomyxa miuraensis]MCX4245166.1 HEAT repeat domain-containing protein [Paraliomyxa miuraensis]